MVSTLVLQNGDRLNFDLDFPPEWNPVFEAAHHYTLDSMEKQASGHMEFRFRNAQRIVVPSPNEEQGVALGRIADALRARKVETVIVTPAEAAADESSPSPTDESEESDDETDEAEGDETPPDDDTEPDDDEEPEEPAKPPRPKKRKGSGKRRR